MFATEASNMAGKTARRAAPPRKRQEKLDKEFKCPFRNYSESVVVELFKTELAKAEYNSIIFIDVNEFPIIDIVFF
jgi:hypothetical protein